MVEEERLAENEGEVAVEEAVEEAVGEDELKMWKRKRRI